VLFIDSYGITAKGHRYKPVETGSGIPARPGSGRKTPGLVTLRASRVNAAKDNRLLFQISYHLLWSLKIPQY